MSEARESYITQTSEQFTKVHPSPITSVSERRILDHIRQFRDNGCAGVVIIFDDDGFRILTMTREKRA